LSIRCSENFKSLAGLDGAQSRHNDAQKNNGHYTLALFTGTKAGSLINLPGWLDF